MFYIKKNGRVFDWIYFWTSFAAKVSGQKTHKLRREATQLQKVARYLHSRLKNYTI